MNALTKNERDALLTEIDEFNTRLANKQRERDAIGGQKAAIARDVVTGKSGAKSAALNLDDSKRELDIEIAALETAIADSQQRWDDDAPARAREFAVARKAKAQEAALRIMAASRRADEAVASLVAALEERAAMAVEFGQFIDLTNQNSIQQVPALLGGALAKAGVRKFDSSYQLAPNGANGFAENDAQTLGAILPQDDPSRLANMRRQDAINEEYRRQQGLHTEIVGPKVTVVSPGRP